MILVVHDNTGRIQQCVTHFETGLEDLSKKYDELGIAHVLISEDFDMMNSYILDGEVVDMPAIQIEGIEDRALKADGVDVFPVVTTPPSTMKVFFGETEIAKVQTSLTSVDLTSDHPGTFTLVFEAEWPYRQEVVIVEAVS